MGDNQGTSASQKPNAGRKKPDSPAPQPRGVRAEVKEYSQKCARALQQAEDRLNQLETKHAEIKKNRQARLSQRNKEEGIRQRSRA